MKHLGDITKIKGDAVELVDVVTGGSPCQDLSVAGKRAGLAGERSGLFMEQIRIIKEMRNESRKRLRNVGADYDRSAIKPRYMVWENVAGAFSSNAGEDFRAVLEETAKVADKDAYVPGLEGGKWSPCGCILGNGWSIAWRLHDAQYYGVPQRRKRICLLADFNGDTAGRILFELQRKTVDGDREQTVMDSGKEPRPEVQSVSKGLSGDIAQSGKERQGIAEDTERSIGEASYTLKVRGGAEFDRYGKRAGKGALVQTELSGTLGVSQDQTLIQCMNPWDVQSKHIQPENGVADPLYAGECRGGGGESYVMQAIAFEPGAMSCVYGISSYDSNAMKSDNPHSGIYKADTSRTLDLNGGNPGCNQGGMAVVQGADVYNGELTGETAATLTAASCSSPTHSGPSVVCLEGNGQRDSHKGDGYKESETMYTLNTVEQHAVCIENHPADSRVKIAEDDVCQTLSSRMGTGGGNVPMVMEPQTFSDVASCLSAADGTKGVHSQMMKNPEENFVLEPVTSDGDIAGTLDASYYKGCGVRRGRERTYTYDCSIVRRLTPMECERLQGFDDNWTNIGDWVDSKGKTHKGESDAPRYKALGNSIALPFWAWMAERMMPYMPENPTMASLFDGIGGFPVVFSRCGCKPVWASEIEEFPIAVTKKRFPEQEGGE